MLLHVYADDPAATLRGTRAVRDRCIAIIVMCWVAMGLPLIDNCDLEDLAAVCGELGRWEFQIVVTPLRIAGATGSPVNPVAVF